MIQARGLTRTFDSYTKDEGLRGSFRGLFNRNKIQRTALHPMDLDCSPGQIIGLVGANGAGKTTLIKLLTGLIHPSAGRASVLGYTPHQRDPQFLRQIGVILGQKNQLWWDLTPQDSFELLEQIYDIPPVERKKRMNELAQWLQCDHVLNIQLRRLSLGERMKMEIIGALLHQPKILFLDEPTIGLDLVAQTRIRSFLSEYCSAEKPLIILTSHYMADISTLADRLVLLAHGRKVFDNTLKSFMSQVTQKKKIIVTFLKPVENDLNIEGQTISAGASFARLELPANQVMSAVAELAKSNLAKELKIEESDFEDVMRDFFETQP